MFPWGALVAVAVVAVAATITVTALVGFALVFLSRRRSPHQVGGTVAAVACLSAAGLVVAWGVARVIGIV